MAHASPHPMHRRYARVLPLSVALLAMVPALMACAPHFDQVEYRNESASELWLSEVYRLPGELRLFSAGALPPSISKSGRLSGMPLPDSLRLVWNYSTESSDGPEQVTTIPVPPRGKHDARLLVRRTAADQWVAEWVDLREEEREFREFIEAERKGRGTPP